MPTEWIAVWVEDTSATMWAMSGDTLQSEITCASQELTSTLFEMTNGGRKVIIAGHPDAPLEPVPTDITKLETQKTPDGWHLIPGLRQNDPPAITWSAETLLRGFLSLNPDWDGIACLPGTARTHWLHISANEVVSFETFLTPTLLGKHVEPVDDLETYSDAVARSLSRPEYLAAYLARAEAQETLSGQPTSDQRLGSLIGAELAATRPYWLGQNVVVIGPDALSTAYIEALKLQAAPASWVDRDTVLKRGLSAFRG